MKAIVQTGYGSPNVLELREIDAPPVNEEDVLVRVRAAGIHAGDYYAMMGAPYGVRFVVGFPKPKNYVPGYDLAGIVEETGSAVTRFQPGDEVFGACKGGCAELVSTAEEKLVSKPESVDYLQAGAVATSALAALHGLRDAGKVQPGMKVLINGASGGVGTFGVQIAKALGAEVTGVCSGRNVEMVSSIGADHVIDYTREDFTQNGQQYDLILDNATSRSFAEYKRALSPSGRVIPNSGNAGMGPVASAMIRSFYARQQGRPYYSSPKQDDLLTLRDMLEAGKIRTIVDRTYSLDETPEAMAYIGQGHAQGKVVIRVGD
ncbi:MAG: NAD(P)-dependent alcohol dehydrogenase [Caldilineaceae bacterium]|jgi:NADPH:quinone reductase-like Zn-dependent oxidoreductase